MKTNHLILAAGMFGALALSGCVLAPVPAERWGQQEYYGGHVYQQLPPAYPVEVYPPSPYLGGIWIQGYWRYDRDQYYWAPGRWSPPRQGYSWHQHQWEQVGPGRLVPRDGYWQQDSVLPRPRAPRATDSRGWMQEAVPPSVQPRQQAPDARPGREPRGKRGERGDRGEPARRGDRQDR